MKEQFCTIFLVRHGETDYNLERRIQGHLAIPLNNNGVKQAKEAAQKFAHHDFNGIYASDLIRASKTAEIIAQEHNITVALTHTLRERGFGKQEGKTLLDPESELTKSIENYLTLTPDAQWDNKPYRGWESNTEIVGRAFTYLRSIATSHINKRVLMVTHGGVMTILLAHLGEISRKEMWNYNVKNLAHIELQSDGITFTIKHIEGIKHNLKKT